MHLGLRLLFAFVAITGLAAFFVLRVFVTEIKPSVGEVMEDLMVDTANLLAEVAAPELQSLPRATSHPGQDTGRDCHRAPAGPGPGTHRLSG
jgi:two-component system sensor histidine kinase CreC